MLDLLTRNWWALALRGAIAIVFGVLAIAWPGITLLALAVLFGVFVLVEGLSIATMAITERRQGWWLPLLEGVLLVAIGVIVLRWPAIGAYTLLVWIGIRAIIAGVLEIAAAPQLRQERTGEWFLGLSGIISIIFGVLVIAIPSAGALAVVWVIGVYAIIFGVLMIALALHLHAPGRRAMGGPATAAPA